MPVGSPRKLFIIVIYINVFLIKVSKTYLMYFWKQKHCWWSVCGSVLYSHYELNLQSGTLHAFMSELFPRCPFFCTYAWLRQCLRCGCWDLPTHWAFVRSNANVQAVCSVCNNTMRTDGSKFNSPWETAASLATSRTARKTRKLVVVALGMLVCSTCTQYPHAVLPF